MTLVEIAAFAAFMEMDAIVCGDSMTVTFEYLGVPCYVASLTGLVALTTH